MIISATLRVFENGAFQTGMPAPPGGCQIDLIGANAETANRLKLSRRAEHVGGQSASCYGCPECR